MDSHLISIQNQKLINAAEIGDIDAAKSSVLAGAQINILDIVERTPLMLATDYGHFLLVKVLYEWGADLNYTNEANGSALMLAALKNNIPMGQLLLDLGINLNTPNRYGNTPLMAVAYNGKVLFLKMLIERKAKVNLVNDYGNPALNEAVVKGHIEVVHVLIRSGATLNVVNLKGESTLMLAVLHKRGEIFFTILSAMPTEAYCGVAPQFNTTKLFLDYQKQVKKHQNKLFNIFGTLTRVDKKAISFLDLHMDLMVLILEKFFPEWYFYRLPRDITFVTNTIFQTIKNRPPKNGQQEADVLLEAPPPTLLFSQMKISSPLPHQNNNPKASLKKTCTIF